jgi:hypothetical protein
MTPRLMIATFALMIFMSSSIRAEEKKGTIKSINIGAMTFVLSADGKDIEYKYDGGKTMFLDKEGKPIPANRFAKGKKFTVESRNGMATKLVAED